MKNALITGANSGLGFEAARQLAADPSYTRLLLVCRTQAKGEEAARQLAALTGSPIDRFPVLALDVSSLASTCAGLGWLVQHGTRYDYVLLNAGCVGTPNLERTEDGIEMSYAASLTGHFVLVQGLIEHQLLAPQATLVLSGAEAATGTLPGMTLYDVHQLAETQFGGDRVQAMVALARGDAPETYDARNNLATLKAFSAWWGLAHARRLVAQGHDARFFVVSPGGTPGTNGKNNLPRGLQLFLKLALARLKLVLLERDWFAGSHA